MCAENKRLQGHAQWENVQCTMYSYMYIIWFVLDICVLLFKQWCSHHYTLADGKFYVLLLWIQITRSSMLQWIGPAPLCWSQQQTLFVSFTGLCVSILFSDEEEFHFLTFGNHRLCCFGREKHCGKKWDGSCMALTRFISSVYCRHWYFLVLNGTG